jgi:hypothetical protein
MSSSGDGEEAPLQFGGGHVLELFDLTPAVRTQHLEAFLERLCSGHPVQPTIKYARPPAACCLGLAAAGGADAICLPS